MRRGRCLCGAVTYEVDGEPVVVAHCHCTDCQRLSGSGHTTGAMFRAGELRLQGAVSEVELKQENDSTVVRAFCPKCGSPIFGRNTRMPGYVTITVGTLDDPESVTPQVVVFARTKRSWDAIDAALPAFDTQPDWKPEDGV